MIEQISPSALPAWVQAQRSAGLEPMLLDVREGWELATASMTLAGTHFQHTPMQQIPQVASNMDASQPIAVLCHHGMRSMSVARYLQAQGFTQLANIAGGIDACARELDPKIAVY